MKEAQCLDARARGSRTLDHRHHYRELLYRDLLEGHVSMCRWCAHSKEGVRRGCGECEVLFPVLDLRPTSDPFPERREQRFARAREAARGWFAHRRVHCPHCRSTLVLARGRVWRPPTAVIGLAVVRLTCFGCGDSFRPGPGCVY